VREICEFSAAGKRAVGFVGLSARKNVSAKKFHGKADNGSAQPQR